MNSGLALPLAVLALAAAACCSSYPERFDNIDVDELFSNTRLYKSYVDCLLADADTRCTADAKELKRVVPDAVSTGCEKCSEKQKVNIKKIFVIIRKNHPNDWAKLSVKWDPDRVYSTKYKEWLED